MRSSHECTMAGPFRATTTPDDGGGSLLRSKRRRTFDALEDLLARSKAVRVLSIEAVRSLCDARGVDLARKYVSDRKHFYRRYLVHCLEDRELSEEENAELEHLRGLLHLGANDVGPIHDEVAEDVYGKAVAEVLGDLKIDSAEAAFLRRLQEQLAISARVAEELLAEGERKARDRVLTKAASRDADFVEYRAAAGQFTGRADNLQDAVEDALGQASLAIPSLHWFELTHIGGYTEAGGVKGWHVTLRAGIRPEDG